MSRSLGSGGYEIKVRGQLDGGYWAGCFEGMTVIAGEDGETLIRGPLPDQAALYGLLARLRDLALPLLSVNRIQVDQDEEVYQ